MISSLKGNQLNLFEELLQREDDQGKLSRISLIAIRNIRFVRSSSKAVFERNVFEENQMKFLLSNLDEAEMRATLIFKVVSDELPDFYKKSLSDVVGMIKSPAEYEPTRALKFKDFNELRVNMANSIILSLEKVERESKALKSERDCEMIKEQVLKIKKLLR